MHWLVSIWPRIRIFVPAATILEIGPGFGRWTHYLKDVCDRLLVVDLARRCIEHCTEEFRGYPHVSCYVNDGKSLDMVSDVSVDFAFSYDSLVHAESDVMEAYVSELARTLKPDGVAFLHHSNLGEYPYYRPLCAHRRLYKALTKMSVIQRHHNRAHSMTAELMAQYCDEHNLRCMIQEKVNWRTLEIGM